MKGIRILHQMVWGPWTLVLFLGAGIWFTLRSGVFQVRGFRRWWKATAGVLLAGEQAEGAKDAKDVGVGLPADAGDGLAADVGGSPAGTGSGKKTHKVTVFQSACTALAATIGTGNIVGVATALTAGGPGALFWMWVSALIGMITAYVETSLGQQYRYRKEDGEWMCGPMVYMDRGLGCPALGTVYALFAVCASLGMGSMVQSNSMSGTLAYSAGVPTWCSAVLVTLSAGLVILGGTGRIARVSERLMPLSAGIYILFSLAVILSCYESLPAVFGSIFKDAFRIEAAAGGAAGYLLSRSVRYGLSRGVFSNEAGLGSLAVLHGAAEDTTPEQQGMWAMFEVFFDTIVICTLTALVILCIGQVYGMPRVYDGAALTAYCFSRRLGTAGEVLVSGAMVVFAFATIIAWYYLGKQTAGYLLRRFSASERVRRAGERLYGILYLTAVFTGCVCRLELVWLVSDIWNGLMAYPNILTLLWMSGEVHFPAKDF